MTKLVSLKLSGLNLDYVSRYTFAGLVGLQELHLGHSHLVTIEDYSFESLTNLKELDLSFNAKLSALNSSVFEGLTSLEKLNFAYSWMAFAYNPRRGAQTDDAQIDENLLVNLHSLKYINLTCALARQCAAGLDYDLPLSPDLLITVGALEVLDLSQNGLAPWTDDIFANNSKLAELYLSDNNLVIVFKISSKAS